MKMSEHQKNMLRAAPVIVPIQKPFLTVTAYSLIKRGLLRRERGQAWNDPTVLHITPKGREELAK